MDTITDWRDIRTIPHDRCFNAYNRRPKSYMEKLSGYRVIRATRPYLLLDGEVIVGVIRKGSYVVQMNGLYTYPLVYDSYRALQKAFLIPKGQDARRTEDLSWYDEANEPRVRKLITQYDRAQSAVAGTRRKPQTVRAEGLSG